MAKLSTSKPRLSATAPRLHRKSKSGAERDRDRDQNSPSRRWYKTARWQKLRARVLKRDKYTCQQTGQLLVGKHPAPNSPVADHKTPHRNREELFFDENNVEAVSKAYHDRVKQARERAGWYS